MDFSRHTIEYECLTQLWLPSGGDADFQPRDLGTHYVHTPYPMHRRLLLKKIHLHFNAELLSLPAFPAAAFILGKTNYSLASHAVFAPNIPPSQRLHCRLRIVLHNEPGCFYAPPCQSVLYTRSCFFSMKALSLSLFFCHVFRFSSCLVRTILGGAAFVCTE